MLRTRLLRNMSSYTERMAKTGRPISPHITIYAFPTIAWSSVVVRATGMVLTIGTTGIACMALTGGSDKPARLASELASSSAAPLAKFAVGFPLTYHFLGAIRHTYWDLTAKGFTNAQMLQSSYALMGTATIISLALATAELRPRRDD